MLSLRARSYDFTYFGGPGSTQGARKAMSGRVAGVVNLFENFVVTPQKGVGYNLPGGQANYQTQ